MRRLSCVILLLFVVGCDTVEDDEPRRYSVAYSVTGTATEVFVTYVNASGGTEQVESDVPWSVTFQSSSGAFVYVSAQNRAAAGTVITEIKLDAKSFKKSQSEGEHVIATASGSLP